MQFEKALNWVAITEAYPRPDISDEIESTTSGYVWLWDANMDYGTMGWYDSEEKRWWVDSKNFEPTHWAYCVPPIIKES